MAHQWLQYGRHMLSLRIGSLIWNTPVTRQWLWAQSPWMTGNMVYQFVKILTKWNQFNKIKYSCLGKVLNFLTQILTWEMSSLKTDFSGNWLCETDYRKLPTRCGSLWWLDPNQELSTHRAAHSLLPTVGWQRIRAKWLLNKWRKDRTKQQFSHTKKITRHILQADWFPASAWAMDDKHPTTSTFFFFF